MPIDHINRSVRHFGMCIGAKMRPHMTEEQSDHRVLQLPQSPLSTVRLAQFGVSGGRVNRALVT